MWLLSEFGSATKDIPETVQPVGGLGLIRVSDRLFTSLWSPKRESEQFQMKHELYPKYPLTGQDNKYMYALRTGGDWGMVTSFFHGTLQLV